MRQATTHEFDWNLVFPKTLQVPNFIRRSSAPKINFIFGDNEHVTSTAHPTEFQAATNMSNGFIYLPAVDWLEWCWDTSQRRPSDKW